MFKFSVETRYFGDVRVVRAFDPVEGRMLMRADLWYREVQPGKVAADPKGLVKAAESLGDLVKRMATDMSEEGQMKGLITFFGLALLAFAQDRPLDNIASQQYQHEVWPLRRALDGWLQVMGL